jgi:cytochrome c oxidase assembly factor CtaG
VTTPPTPLTPLTGVASLVTVPLHAHAAHAAHADTTTLAVLAGSVLLGSPVAWCYVRGLRRVRSHPQGRRTQRWRPYAAVAGVLVVLVVCSPPVGEHLEDRLSTHMLQHLALIMVAAPLIALASPGQPLLAGLPRGLRRSLVRAARRLPTSSLLSPHLAWALFVAALWLWHLPVAYDAAVRSETLHLLEHAAFLSTAWLFWWHLAVLGRHRLRGPVALLYTLAAVPPGAALGAMLTFPGHPLYPLQAAHAAASGIDPLLDQRIGGLVMWIPIDFAFLLVAVLILARWWRTLELRWPDPADEATGTSPGRPMAADR